MLRLISFCAAALLTLTLGACTAKLSSNQAGTTTVAANDDARHKLQHKLLRRLSRIVEGSYTSTQQAAADPDKEYKEMRLHIKRIWKNRSEEEGLYYYIEQALVSNPLHPARQGVYKLWLRPDDKIESVMYALRRPGLVVGQWEDKEALVSLTPDSLVLRTGCALVMYQTTAGEDGFRGITDGRECTDPRQGAAYTTTDLTVSPTQVIWWERGFDLTDKQVWGPKSGGYIFLKGAKKTVKSSDGPTPTKL